MTRSDALRSVRKAAEVLLTRPLVRVPDRTLMAESLTTAADTIEDAELRSGNYTPEFTWEDVDYLRNKAKAERSLPGLHFKNAHKRLEDIAFKIERTLPPRGN